MRLDDINPTYKTTEAAAPGADNFVKVPGMGSVHIGALQQNILKKLQDLVAKVDSGGPEAIIEANRLIKGPAFIAMFDALAQGMEKQLGSGNENT